MAIPTTTPIHIRYVARGADPIALGTGEIDMMGLITMTAPAPGQAAYLDETLGELNARDYVILKGPPRPAPPAAPATGEAGPGDEGTAEEAEGGAVPEDPKDNPSPEAPAGPPPGPSKEKVRRGSPGFLLALKDYGLRVYGLEFDFDDRAFVFDPLAGLDDPLPPAPAGAAGPVRRRQD